MRAVKSLVFSAAMAGLAAITSTAAQPIDSLPGVKPLTMEGDLSAQMVTGISRFLRQKTVDSVADRQKHWQRDLTSPAAYEASIAPNRERFRKYIGAVDQRVAFDGLEYTGNTTTSSVLGEAASYNIYAVRWPVLPGVYGEGLLLRPKIKPKALVVVIPDADQTPESLVSAPADTNSVSQGHARRLAESGCIVVIPALIDRQDTYSGNTNINRLTNQPHREWIYRQAFQMGRHVIGYEVQKVLAVVDWFQKMRAKEPLRIGVFGHGEGGLLAMYSAALDTRIDATVVSGYFGPREEVWAEPIYRNVWGLLEEFGDAELASLIAPRGLIVEHSEFPKVDGPPASRPGRNGAAPGKISTPALAEVQREFNRAQALVPADSPLKWQPMLVSQPTGALPRPGSDATLGVLLNLLGTGNSLGAPEAAPKLRASINLAGRQERQVRQLEEFTQHLLMVSDRARQGFFWNKLKPGADWEQATKPFKAQFWDEVIGRFPAATLPANPRIRKLADNAKWTEYEVVLDVWPEVYAWGYLLVPKDLKPGERRPVVVCQHGLEGLPADTVDGPENKSHAYYKGFAAKLAERGFITFAPHNPYRGETNFRLLQRQANPLRKSLYSVILAQHDRILDWLSELPMVDPKRIGFYGLSYGGKTAVRVPALLDRYCLSICSADYNDWVRKIVTTESGYSYMYTGEWELMEFNLGHTFNYAEMSGLIAPRPFMVERGHDDGVAPDEWVAYEYSKARRLYAKLGIPERTEIEFFNGPHTINGAGTYKFLHRHLNWPEP